MNTSTAALPARTRYGWRWSLIALGVLSWLSIGCNPQMISMLMMPFGDNNVDPEYKLFAKNKEITLVILTNFERQEIQPDLQAADVELNDQVTAALRKRCADNSHKIKIVPSAQVRSYQLNRAGGVQSAADIGTHFKADYVLDLTINSIGLYEKNYYPPMYRGKTNIAVSLYKVVAKDGEEHKVFSKEFPRVYPAGSGPIDATGMTPTGFRNVFLSKVGNDIAKLFIAYPPDERKQME